MFWKLQNQAKTAQNIFIYGDKKKANQTKEVAILMEKRFATPVQEGVGVGVGVLVTKKKERMKE